MKTYTYTKAIATLTILNCARYPPPIRCAYPGELARVILADVAGANEMAKHWELFRDNVVRPRLFGHHIFSITSDEIETWLAFQRESEREEFAETEFSI
jgi:hypothetical protein